EAFFGERFGAAVEIARGRSEREVRFIGFGEAGERSGVGVVEAPHFGAVEVAFDVGAAVVAEAGASVDATGGDVAPRSFGEVTDPRDGLGKERVGVDGVGARGFAGVDVGAS